MKKLWFCVENKGAFDINLATVVGFTTKRNDDSKVGKYGSGLKYSIPFLLRNNIDFKLFVNGTEMLFGIEVIEGYHNDEIVQTKVVTVNGNRTGLSLDAGPEWEHWFVVRELLQKGLDEEDFSFDYSTELEPREGYTKWYIDAFPFAPVLQNFDSYFSFKRNPIHESRMDQYESPVTLKNANELVVKVYKSKQDEPGIIYYRGFRVGTVIDSVFDYDLSQCDINEYRLLVSDYLPKQMIASAILDKGTPELFNILFANDSPKDVIWRGYTHSKRALIDYVKNSKAKFVSTYDKIKGENFFDEGVFTLPGEIMRGLALEGVIEGKKVVDNTLYSPAILSAEGTSKLNKAMNWFDEQGMCIVNCNVVQFEQEEGREIMGIVDMKTGEIFISVALFDNPMHSFEYLLQTMYEEWAHYQYKAYDETRKFQDALIGDVITQRLRLHPLN